MHGGLTRSILFALLCVGGLAPAFAAQVEPVDADKDADVPALLRANARAEAEWARHRKEDLASRRAFARSLLLDADGDACVAYDPSAGACPVTVEEFNRAVETALPSEGERPPASGGVDSARADLLQRLLDQAYLRFGQMPWRDRDSLEAAYRKASLERVQAFRARLGDSLLHAVYRAHFDRLFKGKRRVRVRVLAASDSGWLASAVPISPSADWHLIDAEDLPLPARTAAATLAPGGSKGPLRVPFGFLCLRYGGQRNIPDTPFEEAVPRLIGICSRPEGPFSARDGESVPDAKGKSERAVAALRLRVWLRPGPASQTRAGKDPIGTDTAGLRLNECGGQDLPGDIFSQLTGFWPVRPGEMLGPLRSPLGIWYFGVLAAPQEERTSGALAKTLSPRYPTPAPVAAAEAKEAALRLAIREAYRRQEDPGRLTAWKSGLTFRFISLPEETARGEALRAPLPETAPISAGKDP